MGIASKLKETVYVYRRSLASGYPQTETWSLAATVKGLFTQLSGRERIGRDGKHLAIDAKLYIMDMDIRQEDRVKIDGDYYDIYSIKDPNNKGRHLQIDMKILPEGAMS